MPPLFFHSKSGIAVARLHLSSLRGFYLLSLRSNLVLFWVGWIPRLLRGKIQVGNLATPEGVVTWRLLREEIQGSDLAATPEGVVTWRLLRGEIQGRDLAATTEGVVTWRLLREEIQGSDLATTEGVVTWRLLREIASGGDILG